MNEVVAGNAAQELLKVSGLPIYKLAKLLGVSRQAYHLWMKGAPMTNTHARIIRQWLFFYHHLYEEGASGSTMDLLQSYTDEIEQRILQIGAFLRFLSLTTHAGQQELVYQEEKAGEALSYLLRVKKELGLSSPLKEQH